ncbi:ParA family protein [Pseudomaricurvus alkylphenolicus]|jgi:chromosome partitioning protein|uniref:ParA family protein n=1 Tax=Pseudomaricurvus alkylphenolicus TaxID=1306991 RepID=UPI00141DBC59|nr:ParA family protein [Pseudomaricurvus alkylphenolicus]NIB40737.1 ParA family protein [Pseudomaricurvus alkylphenolicus]
MFDYNSTVLAVLNQKGGVGKTTVASIIAEYAALYSKRHVLVVDLDMQCNSSDYWVGMETAPQATGGQLPPAHPEFDGDPDLEERSSIADIFFGKAVLPHSTYINEDNGFKFSVDVMVGHPALLERVNTEFDNASGKIASEIINRLGEFLHMPEVAETYDLIILDTGPSRNPIFRAAVRAATHAIIPFEPEEKSIQGINAMLQVLHSENFSRTDEDQLKLVGLCPNKVRSNTKIHKGTLNMLHEELGNAMFPEDIYLPQSTAFPERDLKGITPKSIYEIPPSHTARKKSEVVGEYVMAAL